MFYQLNYTPTNLITLVTTHDTSPFKKLVATVGNDPTAYRLSSGCSTTELRGYKYPYDYNC